MVKYKIKSKIINNPILEKVINPIMILNEKQ